MRFRKYLGNQYASEQNVTEDKKGRKKAIPIITIYFLGYPLKKYPDKSIIRVKRKYFDDITNEELTDGTDPFIESLTHDTIIVQIAAIKKKKHRSRLEQVLSVFEPGIQHGIEIDEAEYPEEYKIIIRRLIKAYVDEYVRQTMDIEDEILADLANAERRADKAEEKAEKAKQEAEKAQQKAEKAQQKAEKAKQEAEKAQQKAEKAQQEAEKAKQEVKHVKQEAEKAQKQAMLKLALKMKKYGESIDEIMKETGLSIKEIEGLN